MGTKKLKTQFFTRGPGDSIDTCRQSLFMLQYFAQSLGENERGLSEPVDDATGIGAEA
ncbi:hypothetical protein DOY81_011574, partial [Sarcophaga bullata]